ncbi:MAG: hypothetical protein CVU05_11350 [Bacteroidetes bacterium HGW-Bacteroidetes-21]|nr:MAG: hypothetical protein CVU05_11350 [Bacteroidetes bacterium HGW-Bacteroidetes-21]
MEQLYNTDNMNNNDYFGFSVPLVPFHSGTEQLEQMGIIPGFSGLIYQQFFNLKPKSYENAIF